MTPDEIKEKVKLLKKESGAKVYPISGVSGKGIEDLQRALMKKIKEVKAIDNPPVPEVVEAATEDKI